MKNAVDVQLAGIDVKQGTPVYFSADDGGGQFCGGAQFVVVTVSLTSGPVLPVSQSGSFWQAGGS